MSLRLNTSTDVMVTVKKGWNPLNFMGLCTKLGQVLPIMPYTSRLRLKAGFLFPTPGISAGISPVEVYERVAKSVIHSSIQGLSVKQTYLMNVLLCIVRRSKF